MFSCFDFINTNTRSQQVLKRSKTYTRATCNTSLKAKRIVTNERNNAPLESAVVKVFLPLRSPSARASILLPHVSNAHERAHRQWTRACRHLWLSFPKATGWLPSTTRILEILVLNRHFWEQRRPNIDKNGFLSSRERRTVRKY